MVRCCMDADDLGLDLDRETIVPTPPPTTVASALKSREPHTCIVTQATSDGSVVPTCRACATLALERATDKARRAAPTDTPMSIEVMRLDGITIRLPSK